MLKLDLIILYSKDVTHLTSEGDGVSSHLIPKGVSIDILSNEDGSFLFVLCFSSLTFTRRELALA